MKFSKNNLILFSIIVLGFVLRIWGANYGPYHPDEPLVINQTLAFGTGNLIPSIYFYPPFFHYILFLAYSLYFVLGWILGAFRVFDNFLKVVLINQMPFYVMGRVLVGILGALTIVPVYKLTKRIAQEKTALIASMFMMLSYLHVRNSHYCTTDVPMTFLLISAYVFVVKIVQENKLKDYLWAGALTALAMATKYNAGILIFCIGFAAILNLSFKDRTKNIKTLKNLFWGYAMLTGVFLIFCSYVVWDFSRFIGFMKHLKDLSAGMNVSTWYRLRVNLFHGLGWPLEVLGILGLVWLFLRKGKKGKIIAIFPILYLVGIRNVGQPFGRYVMPLIPFFAISAAIFLDDIISKLKVALFWKKTVLYSSVVLILFMPCVKIVYMDYVLSTPDVRDLANKWVEDNIPFGKSIAIDNSQYAPHLNPTEEQLRLKTSFIEEGKVGSDAKKKRIELLMELRKDDKKGYELYYFGDAPSTFVMHTPVISYTKKSVLDNNVEYIITNDMAEKSNASFYNRMRGNLTLIKRFKTLRGKTEGYSVYPYSFIPIDDTIFDLKHNGIGINIYKVSR